MFRFSEHAADCGGKPLPGGLMVSQGASATPGQGINPPLPTGFPHSPTTAQETCLLETMQRRVDRAFRQVEFTAAASADLLNDRRAMRWARRQRGEHDHIEVTLELVGLQTTVKGYFETFSDMHMQLDDLIEDGDKVVARVTLTATHTRPVQLGPGAPVFAPTGKKLTWGDIEIWRIAGGKFVEHWDQSDLVGLARQMRPD
jgi:predicted ester cyclase